MPTEFDVSKYKELLREARNAFLADSAYAIAVAKPAGVIAQRQKDKGETGDSTS